MALDGLIGQEVFRSLAKVPLPPRAGLFSMEVNVFQEQQKKAHNLKISLYISKMTKNLIDTCTDIKIVVLI